MPEFQRLHDYSDPRLSFWTLMDFVRHGTWSSSSTSRTRAVGHVRPQHFHFARILRGDSMASSLARHEHYLASFLDLNLGMHILELGCGIGGAALELANFANVTIIGVDDNSDKIRVAISSAQDAHLLEQVTFVRADPLRLEQSLPVKSFDGVYAIEALQASPTFETSFSKIRELLKPGGKFAVYEWCWTSKFDRENPDHCRLAELVETTTGLVRRAPSDRSIEAAIAAIRRCGLQLLHYEDLSARMDEKPWYYPLESAISDPRITWHSSADIFEGINKAAATVLVEAGKRKLFTPMALFVGQRPKFTAEMVGHSG